MQHDPVAEPSIREDRELVTGSHQPAAPLHVPCEGHLVLAILTRCPAAMVFVVFETDMAVIHRETALGELRR